ncbi:zf-HC2 domain-containing protein [bacterium]|nr:zf-HC2 domain-containing protein [bacterium]
MMRKMMAWVIGKKIMGMRIASCKDLARVLYDYIDDELSDSEKRSIDMHLLVCKDCRNYLKTYRDTIQMVRKIPDTPMPQDFSDYLEDLLRKRLAH